jgi:hypothetical protein
LEDQPRFLGVKRDAIERGGEKELNENLGPLIRYLDRQVGRPWNKAFSEIAAHLRAASTVQKHVLDHLWDMVAEGQIAEGGWRQPMFQVDAHGLLRRNPQHYRFRDKRKRGPEQLDRVRLAADLELRKLGGIWYEVRLTTLPEPAYRAVRREVPTPSRPDAVPINVEVVIRQLVTPAFCDAATGLPVLAGPEIDDEAHRKAYRAANPDRRYACAKRQLSGSELRKHGLANDPSYS